MKFTLYNFTNKEVVGDVDIDMSNIEGLSVSKKFLSMHITRMKAAHCGQRNAKVKNRAEVSGTTAKPFKQKGTGKARQGTRRAPHHVGGGVAFGPRGTFRFVKIPKKEARLAKRTLLSMVIEKGSFYVVSDVQLPDCKTKTSIKCLENFGGAVDGRTKFLILFDGELPKNNVLSSSNLRCVKYAAVCDFTTNDLLRADVVVIAKDAAENLSKCLK
ncbi:MAG: 50S ribosomal protein L4 [Alphaproteobacteria bacterium]|nr:50S ribosomal protein L4 [Rickettsiales bacterium]